MQRILARLVAAIVLLVAAGPALPAPAGAAACSDGDGVTVVVDFHELGGGVQQQCDADGAGTSAATLLPRNGFPLDYVQRQPGFVCRVAGEPADDPCVNTPPADAYWGVFWSDGKSGSWKYAAEGVGSLEVPDGGYVALAWQGSSTRNPPGMAPRSHASPTPSATSSSPAAPAGGGPTLPAPPPATSASVAGSATPSASPSSSPSKARRSAHPHARASATATPSVSPVADQSSQPPPPAAGSTGGLPGWAVAGVLLLLVAAAAGITALRRYGERAGP
ncbi:MAG TPA: hypothetical protein PLP61_06300 [Nocardioides sp.]|uniref:hypothetical protein n=1 Tax=Nocardioides sp. TaxID=35761 RepID=UPI002BB6EBAD|nr:hypothetical protein [Nocardioides sp.]HQR26636.1 hypothetical protein [Nocardioides sp.]